MKIDCPHCGKQYSKKGIGTHIWRTHGEGKSHDPNKGYVKGTRKSWNKGLTKKDDERIANAATKLSEGIKSGRIKTAFQGKHLPEDMKEKIGQSMKKAHREGRAWNIGQSRWNNEPSYPEKFFMQVIDNEFEDKNYIREYSAGRYSIDFAWPEKKLAIEIDGSQHQRFKEYEQRDIRKDQYLIKQGWKVLRIKWGEMFHNSKECIKLAKEFIDKK